MKTFEAKIELSDADYAAMMARASGQSDVQMVNSIVTGWCAPYAAQDYQAQLEKLAPLGEKYLSAPANVQAEVDKILDPFQS